MVGQALVVIGKTTIVALNQQTTEMAALER